MPERYHRRILNHLADQRYQPRTVRDLARDLGLDRQDIDEFRQAVDQLADDGQIVLDAHETIALPPPGREMIGIFRRHERGFGFLIPDQMTEHGDLFIPPEATLDALTGDRVRAKVRHDRRRAGGGRSPYTGKIVEIIQRADKRYVGTLIKKGGDYFVQVDGNVLHDPVIIRDPHAKDAKPGDKVVIELIDYPGSDGKLAQGVITERLGEAGEPDVETQAIMRAFALRDAFPQQVVTDARSAAGQFNEDDIPADREDMTDLFICTIDPPDARDFDDAIHIHQLNPDQEADDAAWELGIHIADVAAFVKPGTALEKEAYERGNSTYLPRKVIPMLPELLSNGVCSLQEGVNRYARSCLIRYNAQGDRIGTRFARAVIRSRKRLTYLEAQALIDGELREAIKHARAEPKYPRQLTQMLKRMDTLAKLIRKRRLKQGMIVLGLPQVELIFDDSGRVVDAVPEDDAFTHTIIEMFMVEANEAAAELFDGVDVPMIRRIHPDPDAHDVSQLRTFARVAGFNIPMRPSRKELQALLDAVRNKPAQQAVHLAVLRTLSRAEYSPMIIGHFALASEHYTHFTSPIRRYPDLIVHRAIDAYLDAAQSKTGKGKRGKTNRKTLGKTVRQSELVPDEDALQTIGKHCSTTERNSEAAERELRNYLVLELMATRMGEDFDGTVTGVTGRGVYVQLDKYLIDGFIAAHDLPGFAGERWRLNENTGALVAQRSGKTVTIGQQYRVRIANVDLTRRRMELVVVEPLTAGKKSKKQDKLKSRKQPRGARKAFQNTMQIKKQKKKKKSKGAGH